MSHLSSGAARRLRADLLADAGNLLGLGSPASYATRGRLGYALPVETYRASGGSDTANIQAILNAGASVRLVGDCQAAGLVAATAGQWVEAVGRAKLIKNANGALLTFTADDQGAQGVEFRGDAAVPNFTGANVVSTGTGFAFVNCGSRWAHGAALTLQGQRPMVLGRRDIIQTALAAYDIECGGAGGANLYGLIQGIVTTQNAGGIRMTDCGSWNVALSQFGKLTVQNGGGGYQAGANGGMFTANRITGAVSVGIANSVFGVNQFSAVQIDLAAGTSGHVLKANAYAVGCVINDLSNGSDVEDSRNCGNLTFTPALTATTTNPTLGASAISGLWSERGRMVTATVALTIGAGFNPGAGVWRLSLPVPASTAMPFIGAARVKDAGTKFYSGTVQALQDGTARAEITIHDAAGQLGAASPIVWAAGDEITFTLAYLRA